MGLAAALDQCVQRHIQLVMERQGVCALLLRRHLPSIAVLGGYLGHARTNDASTHQQCPLAHRLDFGVCAMRIMLLPRVHVRLLVHHIVLARLVLPFCLHVAQRLRRAQCRFHGLKLLGRELRALLELPRVKLAQRLFLVGLDLAAAPRDAWARAHGRRRLHDRALLHMRQHRHTRHFRPFRRWKPP